MRKSPPEICVCVCERERFQKLTSIIPGIESDLDPRALAQPRGPGREPPPRILVVPASPPVRDPGRGKKQDGEVVQDAQEHKGGAEGQVSQLEGVVGPLAEPGDGGEREPDLQSRRGVKVSESVQERECV